MAVYLIDFENVNCDGLEGIEKLKKEDLVYIFYSVNANKLTFGLHQKIYNSPAQIFYFEVKTGKKNALDFQLMTYMGYLIGCDRNAQYLVVSKDEGFRFAVDFWKQREINIDMMINLRNENELDALPADMEKQLEAHFTNYQEEIPLICSCISKYKTKQGINNALVKMYDSKKAGEIYKIIKPVLGNKN